MKKTIVSVVSVVAAVVISCLFTSGCKLEPEQVSVIAQSAGLFSAVGWIAVDNPDEVAIESVKTILITIELKAADVQAGSTYTAAVYPEVEKVITNDVPAQYQPICKAGAISLLGGLDLLFAANPTWRESQDVALSVVDAFILGAKNGLGMSENHELMKVARAQANARARVLK
jgi:hypothetical protein